MSTSILLSPFSFSLFLFIFFYISLSLTLSRPSFLCSVVSFLLRSSRFAFVIDRVSLIYRMLEFILQLLGSLFLAYDIFLYHSLFVSFTHVLHMYDTVHRREQPRIWSGFSWSFSLKWKEKIKDIYFVAVLRTVSLFRFRRYWIRYIYIYI